MKHVGILSVGMMFVLIVAGCGRSVSNSPASGDGAAPSGPADSAAWEDPASVAFEPLAHHPRVELSNLRFDKGLGGAESFSVDWRLTAGEASGGTMLAVKQPGSHTMEMAVNIWPNETSGTFSGAVETFGFRNDGPSLESGSEMYLAIVDGDARYKISNSVTSGGASVTSTRQATEEALAQFAGPSAAGLEDVPEETVIPNGTKLKVLSEGKYCDVTVIDSMPDGSLRIKWDDEDFVAVFSRSSLKIAANVLASLPKQPIRPAASASRTPAASSTLPTAPTTIPSPALPTRPGTSSSATGDGAQTDAQLEPIPEDLTLPPGTPLRVLYARQWKPVTLLAVEPDGKLKIHWDGYSDSWDESKPRADLRIETAVLQKLRTGQAVAPAVPANPSAAAGSAPGVISSSTELQPGQKLEAEWGRRWLPVTVKEVLPDGSIKIHWEGYSDSFDEALPRARLRAPEGGSN